MGTGAKALIVLGVVGAGVGVFFLVRRSSSVDPQAALFGAAVGAADKAVGVVGDIGGKAVGVVGDLGKGALGIGQTVVDLPGQALKTTGGIVSSVFAVPTSIVHEAAGVAKTAISTVGAIPVKAISTVGSGVKAVGSGVVSAGSSVVNFFGGLF